MLKRMLDVVCPVKSFRVKDKPDPWFSNYLIERINDKNHLLKTARRSTSIVDWHHARLLKNIVNLEIDTACNNYYNNLCEQNSKNSGPS